MVNRAVGLGVTLDSSVVVPISASANMVGLGEGVSVGVYVIVGVSVGVTVAVGVSVSVAVGVGVGVAVGVSVGVAVGVGVAVAVGVSVGVAVGVGVGVAVGVAVAVLVKVLVAVGVAVIVGVGVRVSVAVGVLVGVSVRVAVGWGDGVAVLVSEIVGVIVFVRLGVAEGIGVAVAVAGMMLGTGVGVSAGGAAIITVMVGVGRKTIPATPVARQVMPEKEVRKIDQTNRRQPRCPAMRRRRQYASVRPFRNKRNEARKAKTPIPSSSRVIVGAMDCSRSSVVKPRPSAFRTRSDYNTAAEFRMSPRAGSLRAPLLSQPIRCKLRTLERLTLCQASFRRCMTSRSGQGQTRGKE
jgi:hypothetical protein